jgi:hypothetical protein
MDTTKRKSIHITNKTNGNKDEPNINFMWEKGNFEDTKGVIRSRISKKNRQPLWYLVAIVLSVLL